MQMSKGYTSMVAFLSGMWGCIPAKWRSVSLRRFGAALLCSFFLACSDGCEASEKRPLSPVESAAQIGERLAQCWEAPVTVPPQVIEVTVRLSFSRTGTVIGQPRVVYVHARGEGEFKEKITSSVLAAIKACTPLPFTPALGAAIAGRIFAIRLNSLPLTGRQRLIDLRGLVPDPRRRAAPIALPTMLVLTTRVEKRPFCELVHKDILRDDSPFYTRPCPLRLFAG
jgi:hypothetical protein